MVISTVCAGGPARTELSLSQKSELVTGMSLGVPSKRHQLMLICRFDRWAESRCGCSRRRLTSCCRWTIRRGSWPSSLTLWTGRLGGAWGGDRRGGAGSASLPSTCAVERVAVRFHDLRSCRKLETACRDQIPYLWLTNGSIRATTPCGGSTEGIGRPLGSCSSVRFVRR